MSVRAAIEHDLGVWEKRLAGVSDSALAALALELASRIDDPATSATAASNCANSLDKVLERIESSLPPQAERDDVDELLARREKRRAAGG